MNTRKRFLDKLFSSRFLKFQEILIITSLTSEMDVILNLEQYVVNEH